MEALDKVAEPIFSPLLHRYTLEEFWTLPEPDNRSHYELIGGYLFMVPPPASSHDDLVARLNRSLLLFLEAKHVQGDVHHPRAAIYRQAMGGTYLEPDMMYVSKELRGRMGSKRSSADIVFECVSASSGAYDRTTKADTYLALGVRELWLIDSDSATVEVRNAVKCEDRPTWEISRFSRGEQAESRVLPGWAVTVDELFEGLT